uniref:Uncharacterized protein n=1 Tax=Corethron hystrix TaxID=216773 RepID=A0A6U5FTJ2_9STRA|mmetsp:Transcript_24327/g.55451  ORF Transcript_24327/g.55451 Transcript_24327/m.55451 type:complete len:485 (+) Transcript_24327:286-1740(+)
MTGISDVGGPFRYRRDDTPQERYAARLRTAAERYSIVQVGICLFCPTPSSVQSKTRRREGIGNEMTTASPEYETLPYNFYIFPSGSSSSSGNGKDVCLSPAAVSFLVSHGMDFGKWMRDGVPFCDAARASHLGSSYRERFPDASEADVTDLIGSEVFSENGSSGVAILPPLPTTTARNRRPSYPPNNRVVLSRPEDITFHANAMAQLREWIDSDRPLHENAFVLPPANAFLRRALYECIGEEYPALILERCRDNVGCIVVHQLSEQEKEDRARLKQEEARDRLEREVGFYRIFRAISGEARRRNLPVVVHNGVMDMLFLLSHFHCNDLPESWNDAKRLIHWYFPLIFDTKFMSEQCVVNPEGPSHAFASTALGDLYLEMCHGSPLSPMVMAPGFDRYGPTARESDSETGPQDGSNGSDAASANDKNKNHEAAYDAYMTGCVFNALCGRILSEKVGSGRVADFHMPVVEMFKKLKEDYTGRNKVH